MEEFQFFEMKISTWRLQIKFLWSNSSPKSQFRKSENQHMHTIKPLRMISGFTSRDWAMESYFWFCPLWNNGLLLAQWSSRRSLNGGDWWGKEGALTESMGEAYREQGQRGEVTTAEILGWAESCVVRSERGFSRQSQDSSLSQRNLPPLLRCPREWNERAAAWPVGTRWQSCQNDSSSELWFAFLLPVAFALPATCFPFPPASVLEDTGLGWLSEGSLKSPVLSLLAPSELRMGKKRRRKGEGEACPLPRSRCSDSELGLGWLASLRDSLVSSVLPLPASSVFQGGGWERELLPPSAASPLGFDLWKEKPQPLFWNGSRHHLSLLSFPQALLFRVLPLAGSFCFCLVLPLIGKKVHQWGDGGLELLKEQL